MSVRVSVVVPTFRRERLLRQCLEKLAQQDFDPQVYEVVVADDGCSRDTAAAVLQFGLHSGRQFRYVAVGPTHGPAAARNCGWRAARGEIIAFTDDDCLPEPGWLRDGVERLDATGAEAATGRVVMPLPERPTDYERDSAGLTTAEFVTANCFCRRSALEQAGGFDERFTAAWREDSDLQFSLLELGCTIAAAPQAVVVHPVRPAPWGVSLRQQHKTQFNVLLYRKHPRLYRDRIAPAPAGYYASVAALTGATAGAAVGAAPLALGSAACWLALTGRFCARRLRGTSHAPAHVVEMAVTSALIPPLALFWRGIGCLRYGFIAPASCSPSPASRRSRLGERTDHSLRAGTPQPAGTPRPGSAPPPAVAFGSSCSHSH